MLTKIVLPIAETEIAQKSLKSPKIAENGFSGYKC